jgi:hypothetical protein
VGEWWFIRNKGAGALQKVVLLDCHGNDVWTMRNDELCAQPSYRQAGVDFDFVQPIPTSADKP